MSTIPRTAGIYRIDGPGGKVYIGSTTNLQKRKHSHLSALRDGTHGNHHLQGAWCKHGGIGFSFSVVEIVDCTDDLIRIEQIWLDILFLSLDGKQIYNIRRIAESNIGVKHSDETRRKVSNRLKGNRHALGMKHTEETKRKIAEWGRGRISPTRGKPLSEEHKRKVSEALRNSKRHQEATRSEKRSKTFSHNWSLKPSYEKAAHAEKSRIKALGKTHTEETKKRISAIHSGKSLSTEHKDKIARRERNGEIWTVISPDGIIYYNIGSVIAFAKEHGVNHKTIRRAVRGRKTRDGWRGYITRTDNE